MINNGDPVLWNAVSSTDSTLCESADITLKVENKKNNKIIAENEITIQREDDLYRVIR